MSTPPDAAPPQSLPPSDSLESVDDLEWGDADSSGNAPWPSGPAQTKSLNAHDRVVLASMQEGYSGIIGFLGAMALIIAVASGLGGLYTIDIRAVVAIASVVVCLLAAVGFVMSRADGKLRSDLGAGIKLIASGRISRMDSEETDGPGFLTVAIDETSPKVLTFFVEKRLYQQVATEELVRIAYVPLSKTILQLRTAKYRYCRRPS